MPPVQDSLWRLWTASKSGYSVEFGHAEKEGGVVWHRGPGTDGHEAPCHIILGGEQLAEERLQLLAAPVIGVVTKDAG